MIRRNSIKPLPYNYYYIPSVLLAIAGIINALYLSFSHYKNFTDLTYSSFCAISQTINCDTVSQSPWSILFGIPIAHWGVLGFLLYLVILLSTRDNNKATFPRWSVLILLGLLFSSISLGFGALSGIKIKAYCILCLLSYLISFSLFFLSFLIYRRFGDGQFIVDLQRGIISIAASKRLAAFVCGIFIAAILLICFLPSYWHLEMPTADAKVLTGVTEQGHHWIGAENPLLIIEEYSDYQCFQCAKTHRALRQLIEKNPDKLRLVHRNYPLDHEFNNVLVKDPFHVGSGKMSLLAIYAGTKGKFWEMNDALYQLAQSKESFNTRILAQKLNLDQAELVASLDFVPFREKLNYDIWQGLKLRITATPSYVIGSDVYIGSIPPKILRDFSK